MKFFLYMLIFTVSFLEAMEQPTQPHAILHKRKKARKQIEKNWLEECGNWCCDTPNSCPCPLGYCASLVGSTASSLGFNRIYNTFVCHGLSEADHQHCMCNNTVGTFGSIVGLAIVTTFACFASYYADSKEAERIQGKKVKFE